MRKFSISVDIAAPRGSRGGGDEKRYLAFEANGLKARSENPDYHYQP
ncbi:MAG: hypothetical protein ABI665_16915 [Vicinamibacterales bacterium]